MNNGKYHQPPRLALRLLRWYCRPDRLEEIEGDLEEFFWQRSDHKTSRYARLFFWLDVFRTFRPYAWRKNLFQPLLLNQNLMLRNYFKTSVRNLLKHKAFAAINIMGLALSMSVCLLLILIVKEQYSIDKHVAHGERIYRIYSQRDGNGTRFATSPIPVGSTLAEDYTQVEQLAQFAQGLRVDALANEKEIFINGIFANNALLSVMDLQLQRGNRANALQEPYSVVLTAEAARKFFGDESPIGKPISMKALDPSGANDYQECIITGVLKEEEHPTHLAYEAMLSMSTLPLLKNSAELSSLPDDWQNYYAGYNYLLLKEGASPAEVESALSEIKAKHYATDSKEDFTFRLQALHDISPAGENMVNQAGSVLPEMVVFFLIGLGTLVLFSAAVNYTNLSVARSLYRVREVGIRKVVGASRSQLTLQFLVESVVIALLALLIASAFLQYLIQAFFGLDGFLSRLFSLQQDYTAYLVFVLFAVLVGITAGLLPAVTLSRFNPLQVLKGRFSIPTQGKLSGKKVLALLQFTFSIIFVVASIIIYQQFKHVMSADLGLNGENVVCIPAKGNQFDQLQQAYQSLAAVEQVSASSLIPNTSTKQTGFLRASASTDSILVSQMNITPSYLDVMKLELLAGRNFKEMVNRPEDGRQLIVNEKAVEVLGLSNPAEAIGLEVQHGGKVREIIGVVKNFRYDGIQQAVGPFMFTNNRKELYHLSLRIAAGDHQRLLASLEEQWQSLDKVHPFEYSFYEDEVAEAEKIYILLVKIIGFAGLLSVVISCLGLLGMAIFNTQARRKEVSIRKVLGASVWQVIFLLSRGFLWLIGLATLIALPLVYVGSDYWLDNFAYRIQLGPAVLLPGVAIILLAGLLTVGSQTLKAARTNPADSLRME